MSEVDSIDSKSVGKVQTVIEINELAPVREKLRLGAVLLALYVSILQTQPYLSFQYSSY